MLLTLSCSLIFARACPQDHSGKYNILFYNVENLFDATDDPVTSDDEFTPEGSRRWTSRRLNQKIINLSKVILNSSGWEPPQMIALCETENRYVIEKLLAFTPLSHLNYNIIHKNSPDDRGIDVAFLYNQDIFDPIEYHYYPLTEEDGRMIKSREILYVSGIIGRSDTLHIFINHWPSRYSGLLESRELRILAARTLRSCLEKLYCDYINPKIVIVGDFNDQPNDISIIEYLNVSTGNKNYCADSIYNLSFDWSANNSGTTKYKTLWYVFDQIMVSGSLLINQSGLFTEKESARIINMPFLFEPDYRYGGVKPLRTYYGYEYKGGFSDHLPVILQLRYLP